MRRFHLSDSPELKVVSENQTSEKFAMKPNGFWYDIDLDWLRWLDGEDYLNTDRPDRWLRPYLYEVEIDESRLRVIRTAGELQAFNQEFSDIERPMFITQLIRWSEVAARYQGIEIAPYQWPFRLEIETFWYYSWDCASGCVWNAEAVKEVKLVVSGIEEIKRFYRANKVENELNI